MTIEEKAIEILEVIIADTEVKLQAWKLELENLRTYSKLTASATGDPVPPDPTHPPKP